MTDDRQDLTVAQAHFAAGRLSEAREVCQQILQLTPTNREAFELLGSIYAELGDASAALQTLEQAIRLHPNHAPFYVSMGILLRKGGQIDAAQRQLKSAIQRDPQHGTAHYELGLVFLNTHRLPEAVMQFEQAMQLDPHFAEAANGLGTVFRLLGRLDESIALHETALRIQPDFADAHVSLGISLKARGELDQAISHYRTALRLQPHHVLAHNNLGFALTQAGHFNEAVTELEAALRLNPNNARTYHNLGQLAAQNHYEFSAEQIAHMKSLLANRQLSADAASNLYFTLAASLASRGEHDHAFDAYRQANDIRYSILKQANTTFDAVQHRQLVDATISTCSPTLFARTKSWGVTSEKPIFIVGMPRSGSTLVEQILASHPQVVGAGELHEIQNLAAELGHQTADHGAYPAGLLHAESALIDELTQQYLQRLDQIDTTADRIVDKMWVNYLHLGLIAIMFPRAHIIHCQREAMDIGLSCYVNNFNHIHWACRLEDIGFYYLQQERLMRHWHNILPLPIHQLRYEQLINDQETTSRAILEFCDLDWHDDCLAFHQSDRSVQTASAVQVRQPIYRSSQGRWRKYEKHLHSLRQLISDQTNGN